MATAVSLIPADDNPLPGIYADVPFETYLAWPYVSNILLKHAKRSMPPATARLYGRLVSQPPQPLPFGSL